MRTYALFLCHAHEDVGALLELLGILCGILEQELREDDVTSHVVEATAKEVVLGLIVVCLYLVHGLGVEVHALGNAVEERLDGFGNLLSEHLFHDVEVGAVGDIADGRHHLKLSGALVDGEDAGVAQQALSLILHDEA